jgi:hypothetical protein
MAMPPSVVESPVIIVAGNRFSVHRGKNEYSIAARVFELSSLFK